MAEPFDLLVIGSVNTDHVVVADTFPAVGETVLGTSVRSSIGGKGANQAVAAALVGARTAFAGRVGADDEGARALAALADRGVDTSLVTPAPEAATGSAWITVAERDNTIVVVPGANTAWPDDRPDAAVTAALRSAAVVLCQLEIPVPVVGAAQGAAAGRFVLNVSPAVTLPDELLAGCDVLVVNQHELAVSAGVDDTNGAPDIAAAHARLLERGVRAVVTTLGPDGAVVTDADGTYAVASPRAHVVDTTGAGDAFAGVLCARLAAGDPLAVAVRWAAAAGSLAVRAAGTHDSYPDLARLRALVEGEEVAS